MNFLENECNEALKKENDIRKKDGLEPIESNLTIIDHTKEVRKELADFDNKLHAEKVANKIMAVWSPEERAKFEKRHPAFRAAGGVRKIGAEYRKLQDKIKYRINSVDERHRKIIFDKNFYLKLDNEIKIKLQKEMKNVKDELNRLSKKCAHLTKKYLDIGMKIEKENIETCPETCLEKYVEKSDALELENIYNKFTKLWNKHVGFINKEINQYNKYKREA